MKRHLYRPRPARAAPLSRLACMCGAALASEFAACWRRLYREVAARVQAWAR